MYLLDTDSVSALRRRERADPKLLAWVETVHPTELFISVITILEIEQGIRQLEHRNDQRTADIIRHWFEHHVITGFAERILPIDLAIARRAAALRVPDPRPEGDSLIAATALVRGLKVVTGNMRHFAAMKVEMVNLRGPVAHG